MGKECTSCRHGVHFLMKLLLIQQMLKKRVTIREEKSKKYEKEKTLESNICGFGQLFCWQLPCLLQHLRQYRQKQQMCRQKQLMKMS